MPARGRAPRIEVYHATAPTCWWSWGYEAVLNRIPLVYGNQVRIHLLLGSVYEDLEAWMRQYEMTLAGQRKWAREAARIMGIPIRTDYGRNEPKNVMPASFAVLAAERQGTATGARFMRSVLRRFCVEGQDVTREPVLKDAAREADLDISTFLSDCADTVSRRKELEHQGRGFPHVPLGFYNLAVTDGRDRTVLLDYAFDPAIVEGAIDYLAGHRLTKRRRVNIADYLRRHGPAPAREIARVAGLTDREAMVELTKLAGQRRAEALDLAGMPHWRAGKA